jgi:putative lipase involved disintegration of autophagic bodies
MKMTLLRVLSSGLLLTVFSNTNPAFAGTNVGVTSGAGYGPTIKMGAGESVELLEEKGTTQNVTQQIYSIGESIPIPEFGGHKEIQTLIKTQSNSVTNYNTTGTSNSLSQDYTTGIQYDFNYEVSGGIGY